MVQTAVADVISPTITADDPYALAHQQIRQAEQVPGRGIFYSLQALFQQGNPFALVLDAGFSALVSFE